MPYTLAQAREIVKANVQAGIDPTLTDLEVEGILTATAWASVWATTTAYTYGQRVLPTVPNGHVYTVLVAGTSGATEPTWPTGARQGVADGSTLVWAEAGSTATNEQYHLRAATYDAWLLKLAKAQRYYNFSADGQSVSRKDVVDNIRENMRAWAPVGVV